MWIVDKLKYQISFKKKENNISIVLFLCDYIRTLLNKNYNDDDYDWFWIPCCRTFFFDITFFQSLNDCLNDLEITIWNFLKQEETFLWFSFIWVIELRNTFFALKWRKDQRWNKWTRKKLFFELWFIYFNWTWRYIRYRLAWKKQKQRSNN